MRMHGALSFLLAFVLCTAVFAAPREDETHRRIEMTAVAADGALAENLAKYGMKAYRTTNGGPKFSCLMFSPKDAGRRRLPLIVYIPGSGEIGEDLVRQFHQHALFDLVTSAAFQKRHPCHLVALSPPREATTLSGGSLGHPSRVQQMLMAIVTWAAGHADRPGVDPNRIYLTGFSYGGNGVTALATHYPGEFAAVVPISSGPPHPEYIDAKAPGCWWQLYNELDFAGCDRALDELYDFCDGVNAAGGDFRIGTYPAAGHDAWTKAWREDAVWDWMFSKSLDARQEKRMRGTRGDVAMALESAVCTASVPGSGPDCGPARAVDGLKGTAYEPKAAFTRDDWWRLELDRPAKGRVKVVFGDRRGRNVPSDAVVESSSDGRVWRRLGAQKGAEKSCAFVARDRFRFLRIRSQSADAMPFAITSVSVIPGNP